LLAVFISLTWGFKGLLSVKVFSETETTVVFILLLFNIFVKMYSGVYHGVFKATSLTHIVIMTDNIVRLVELVILFAGIILKLDIITILIIYSLPAFAGMLFKHLFARRIFVAKFSFHYFDFTTFKSMIKPSVAFMLMPLGFAVSNQGLVFVVNALLGPVVLVAFTTTRTLVNFLRGLMNMLATAINPEITAAYGRNDKKTMINIYYRSLIITFAITLAGIIALLFVGKPVYLAWTKHTVMFNEGFFIGMLFVLLISCLWGLSSIVPLATNTHGQFTIAFLISQVAGVVICYACLKIEPHIAIIPFALFVTELALFVYTLTKNNQFLTTNFREMRDELWQQTKFLILKITNFSKS
jgi:O-antigen/teichoic acid export membrane protein